MSKSVFFLVRILVALLVGYGVSWVFPGTLAIPALAFATFILTGDWFRYKKPARMD